MASDIQKILVTGALGQIGSDLTLELRKIYGKNNVIASDIRECDCNSDIFDGPYEKLDVLDFNAIEKVILNNNIDTVVHLAAILSGVGEKDPLKCWNINMNGSLNILNLGVKHKLNRIFIPSSIAVWGPDCPKHAPQETNLQPTTMYGVTKVSTEILANYFIHKFGLDVRGLRFPGIISSETLPGGGTTDYAVAIYYGAVTNNHYTCFVKEDTKLPMMYMPDCIKATINLLQAPLKNLKHHTNFNVGAMSFTVKELADTIRKYKPDFTIDYKPDFRQEIADSWPQSVDDSAAREEWGWKPDYDIDSMTKDMLEKLEKKHKEGKI